MTTPEPLDEFQPAPVTETRGGDHLADIVLPVPGYVDEFLDDPSTGVTRQRPEFMNRHDGLD